MAMIPARNRKRVGYQEGDTVTDTETTPTVPSVVTSPYSTVIPEQKATLGAEEKIIPTALTEQPTEVLPSTLGELQTTPRATLTASPTTNLNVAIPETQATNTYTAYTGPATPTAIAAQGSLDSRSIVGEPSMLANATALEQGVSAGSQATPVQ